MSQDPCLRPLPGAALILGRSKIDTATGDVRRGGSRQHLEPRTLGVLLALAERPGETMTKQEIFERVWPDVVVSEASIWRSISDLRQALDETSGREPEGPPSCIETLPRRGYRLRPEAKVRWSSPPWTAARWLPVRPGRGAILPWSLAALLAAVLLLLVPAGHPSTRPSMSAAAFGQSSAPRPAELVDGAERALALGTSSGIERAIELAQWAIQRDPQLAAAHATLADGYRRKGELAAEPRWMAAALDSVNRALELAPQSARAHASHGSLLQSQGRLLEGEAAYRRSLELDPSNTKAANNLGLLLLGRGDGEGAARMFRQLVTDHPQGEIYLNNLGCAYLAMDDLEGARRALEQAVAVSPRYWRSHTLLAQIDLLEGNLPGARKRLEPVLAQGIRFDFGYRVAAWVALTAGDLEGARLLLEPLTGPGRQITSVAASLLQAEVLRRSGQPRQAAEAAVEVAADCRRRLQEGSEEAGVYRCLAAVAAVSGDAPAAATWLQEAIDRGYRGTKLLVSDPVFTAVAQEPVFLEALARLEI